jgi:hypothetical protein
MLRERGRQFVARGMRDCQARANDALFALVEGAADADEQSRCMDAMRTWHGGRRAVSEGFSRRVDLAFAALGDCARAVPQTPAEPLRLVDDEELAEIIMVDAMAAAAAAAVRQPLAELGARVEALLGAPLGTRELPLSPEFVIGAFAREIAALGVDSQARQVLLRAGKDTLLRTLPEVIDQANELLRDLGVGVAAEPESATEVAQAPAAPDALPDAATDAAREAAGPGRPPAATPGRAVSRRPMSRRLLATLPPGYADPEADHGARRDLAELFGALTGEPRRRCGVPRRGLLARAQAALAQQGSSLASLHPLDRQLLTLVDTLFEAMEAGTWMPEPLSELLAGADLPVAALASGDPSFIDKPWHPGRRLLNEIIAAATDYLDLEGYADQDLFRRAGEAIESLGRLAAEPRRLAQLLAEFVVLVEGERERTEKLAERALGEAAARERTNLAHRRVAEVLNGRLAGRSFPLGLVNLLERAWCRVLFLAWFRGGEGSRQWRTALHLLDQLLGLLGDDRPDAELVERLWGALGERLEEIAFDSFEARRLLADLRGCLAAGAAPSGYPPGTLWTPEEARELGDPGLPVAVTSLNLALPGEPGLEGGEEEGSLSDIDLSRADSLRVGGWVEFEEADGARVRARLLGVVQPSGTHVLSERDGGAVRPVSRRRLALAMKEGRLIALDNSRLFEAALEQGLDRVAAAG